MEPPTPRRAGYAYDLPRDKIGNGALGMGHWEWGIGEILSFEL